MDTDTVVRWGALSLVAVAGVAAYFVASGPAEEAPAVAEPQRADVVPAISSPRPSGQTVRVAEVAPGAASARPPRPLPTPRDEPLPARPVVVPPRSMAVDLPIVTGPMVDAVEPTRAAPAQPVAVRTAERPGPCGGVLVRVITASSDPEWAFATIADGPGKPARMRRVGDPVASWRVDSIEWDRVWLQNGGTRCAAGIHDGARSARVAVGLGSNDDGPLEAADDVAPAWFVPPDVADAIHQRSATEFVIDERAIATIFERGPDLLAGVEFEPVKQGDGVAGVSLDSIPTHSLLDRLGIEKGDIVLALNDNPVLTLDAVIAALGDARARAALVASLQRDGQAFAIDVAVAK
jgi:type II secretory pathway component PulC